MIPEFQAYPGFRLIRPLLFRSDAETAHDRVQALAATALRVAPLRGLLQTLYGVKDSRLNQQLMGLNFPAPLGLAAGFDKDGRLIHGVHALGFGFCEVGTVTLRPQAGNPKPRLWRQTNEGALINSLGFNNAGADALVERFSNLSQRPIPLGINIGMNRDTPLDLATEQYRQVFEKVYPHADYLVVNVSSPNTPGLRELQKPQYLEPLLGELLELGGRLALKHGLVAKPLLVKLAPELADLDEQANRMALLAVLRNLRLPGVVISNTLKTERGGLSGQPLHNHAVSLVRQVRLALGEEVTIVGVGGIFGIEQAMEFLGAGANLLQVYTGWIYRGPSLVPKIHRSLLKAMNSQGLSQFSDFRQGLTKMASVLTLQKP